MSYPMPPNQGPVPNNFAPPNTLSPEPEGGTIYQQGRPSMDYSKQQPMIFENIGPNGAMNVQTTGSRVRPQYNQDGNLSQPVHTSHGTIMPGAYVGPLCMFWEHNPMLYMRKHAIYDFIFFMFRMIVVIVYYATHSKEPFNASPIVEFMFSFLYWLPLIILTRNCAEDAYVYQHERRKNISCWALIRILFALLCIFFGIFWFFYFVIHFLAYRVLSGKNWVRFWIYASIFYLSRVLFSLWTLTSIVSYIRARKEMMIEANSGIGFVRKLKGKSHNERLVA